MLGGLGTRLGTLGAGLGTGGVSGPYPAPTGYRWDYVVSGSEMVVSNNEPVVTLVRMN